MQITQELREYAQQHQLDENEALKVRTSQNHVFMASALNESGKE